MGSHKLFIEWWHFQWLRRTRNQVFKVMAFLKSNISRLRDKVTVAHWLETIANTSNGTMFGDLDWPPAIAEFTVCFTVYSSVPYTVDRGTVSKGMHVSSNFSHRLFRAQPPLQNSKGNPSTGALDTFFCGFSTEVAVYLINGTS